MRNKRAYYEEIARKVGLKAAIVENDLAYLAVHKGVKLRDYVRVEIPWNYLHDKYDYMTIWDADYDKDGRLLKVNDVEDDQDWLMSLESAGIIEFDSNDESETWVIDFPLQYLLERSA